MFVKIFDGGGQEHFLHAPPQTPLDKPNGRRVNRKLPKPAHAGVPDELNSIYYYYWAFLRLNDEYLRCCENGGVGRLRELYQDFGDVRDDDFITWWRSHGVHCFAERSSGRVLEVDLTDENHGLHGVDPNKSIVLRIDLGGDLSKIMEAVKRTLKKRFETYKKDESTALHKIRHGYQLGSLHKILEVAEVLRSDPSLEGAKLGAAVNRLRVSRGLGAIDFSDDSALRRLRKRKEGAMSIVANVIADRFPVYEPE